MVVLTLLGLIMLAIWAGSLYLWPFGPSLRCKGSGRNKGSTGRRYGESRSLQGSGRRRRIGAKTIHRGTVSLADKARARRGAK
jgi:hypothetical protein